MFQSPYGMRGQGGVSGVFGALATLAALAATIFVAPSIWPAIEAPVTSKLTQLYGWQAAYWLGWCIHIMSFPLCFTLIRAGLMGVMTALSVYAMKWLT